MPERFILPITISPFFCNTKRFPRKIKKKYSDIVRYNFINNNQKRWNILLIENPEYVNYIISKICKNEKTQTRGFVQNMG